MSASVYILWHQNENRFKTGKANDVYGRAAQLRIGKFNFDKSITLTLKNETEAYLLEGLLHRALHKWSLPVDEMRNEGETDGATEWFQAKCWDRLNILIDQISDLFSFKKQEASHITLILKEKNEIATKRKAILETKKEEAQHRKQAKKEEKLRMDSIAKSAFETIAKEAINSLVEIKKSCTAIKLINTTSGRKIIGILPYTERKDIEDTLTRTMRFGFFHKNGGRNIFTETGATFINQKAIFYINLMSEHSLIQDQDHPINHGTRFFHHELLTNTALTHGDNKKIEEAKGILRIDEHPI